jgi:hypothetical protein
MSWASFKDILTLSLAELLMSSVQLCEWYSYFHWWIVVSTLKLCMKDPTNNPYWQNVKFKSKYFFILYEKSVQYNFSKIKTIMNCFIDKLRGWLRASSKRSECSDLWILCSSSELLEAVTITHHRQMRSERFCSSQGTIHNMCWIHLFQSSDIHWLNCICHFTCQGHTLC